MPRIKPCAQPCLAILTLLMCLLASFGSRADDTVVRATVDRSQLALDETLTLTLSADSILFSDEPDVDALRDDFHILNRQQSSRTNIINGEISSSRQWDYTLAPKREGDLTIPAIAMGKKKTKALSIRVSPASSARARSDNSRQVWLEADISPRSGYVQQMLEYSVKLYSSLNFLDASLDSLEVDNALVEPLGESRYRQRIDGRSYQVIERRYGVFPQRSGKLEIPALTLQARVESYRPSLLDPGRLLVRRSAPITLSVQSPPAEFDGALWLPASKVELFEEWSSDPEQLYVGQSITRRIDIRAEGMLAAQLPALPSYSLPGAKLYPDQASLQNSTDEQVLVGLRSESTAIIFNEAGRYTLPEIRIAWFNTRTQQTEVATLPARQIEVSPAPGAALNSSTEPSPAEATRPATNPAAPNAASSSTGRYYQAAIAALIVSNLLSLGLLLRSRRPALQPPSTTEAQPSEKQAYQKLKRACQAADALASRRALQDWAASWAAGTSLATLAKQNSDLKAALEDLDRHLYHDQLAPDYTRLLKAVTRLRSQRQKPAIEEALPPLYPKA